MKYEITHNGDYGSYEVAFDGIPPKEVREALKGLKMRYHALKKCWYGYANEYDIIDAISSATPDTEKFDTTIYTDGYMGGRGYYGSKSHLNLYGQDLKKAIATDVKKAGFKGVTFSMKRDHLVVKVKTTAEDFKTFDEFLEHYHIKPAYNWIYYFDNDNKKALDIFIDNYYKLSDDEREHIRYKAAEFEYYKEAQSECCINHYHIDKYNAFSETGLNKIYELRKIIEAYRYDNSNGMVDYFDTNFYYDIILKPVMYK